MTDKEWNEKAMKEFAERAEKKEWDKLSAADKLMCEAMTGMVRILSHLQRASHAQLQLLIELTPDSDRKQEILRQFVERTES